VDGTHLVSRLLWQWKATNVPPCSLRSTSSHLYHPSSTSYIWTAFSCTIRASTLPSRDHRYIHLLQLEGSTPLTCHQTQLLLWLRVQLAAVTTNTINLRKLQYPQHRGMSIIKLSPTPASPAICQALTASASAKSGFHTIKPHPA